MPQSQLGEAPLGGPGPTPIEQQFESLAPELRAALNARGFELSALGALADRLIGARPEDNWVRGELTPPHPGDIRSLPEPGSAEHQRLRSLGAEALRQGQVALVVLAGGMATRMGGIVKALVEALPGQTFLDLRLREARGIERRYGARFPLWFMTSSATDAELRRALGAGLDGQFVATFQQSFSLRLTPNGELYRALDGRPSEYATGHGDLPSALQRSGLLRRFVDHGGRVVMVTNLDNLGGTIDEAVIGFHLDHGLPVTSEVVDKLPTDRGGVPVYLNGHLCVLEELRIPPGFDPAQVSVFNTNVFHFDAAALLALDPTWSYFSVRKNFAATEVVQFERLLNEVTSFLPTRFLKVPRQGKVSRFLPVKDNQELALRQDEIADVMQRVSG